jgi:hypothetical protein
MILLKGGVFILLVLMGCATSLSSGTIRFAAF